MKYIVWRAWPTMGGARMIPARTVIDTSSQAWLFLDGLVPPHDCTPLDAETREVMVKAYPSFTIAPVGTETETSSN